MSDDLSAFFAKKKDKKKKAAVKIEEVGQVLERKAKRQEEEQEHDDVIEKRGNAGGEEEKTTNNPAEESEWIEYGESQGRLEGLKIKDMGLESEQDQVNNEEPEEREVHETKTWGQVSSEKKATEETEQAVTISDKAMAAAYKPPAMRQPGRVYKPRGPAANLDMSSDAAFPSLADASKIEKVKKEESKSPGGWVKAGSSGPGASSSGPSGGGPSTRSYNNTTSGTGREAALAAAKSIMSSSPAAPTRSEMAPPASTATPAAPASSIPAPSKGAYIPPHMRNKQ